MPMAVKFDVHRKRMCKMALKSGLDVKDKDKEDRILASFQAWDLDQNGFISREELRRVLQRLGDLDAEHLLKEADLDSDGRIDYEEMVHWLCRAPYLEEYFLTSVRIFKQTWQDLVQELRGLVAPEGDLKLSIAFMKNCNAAYERMQMETSRRIEVELTPLIKKSFAYHDKDDSGHLSYEESVIFFSNFMALWEPFSEVMAELNIICFELSKPKQHLDRLLDDVKVMRPDQLHSAFRDKYALLKQQHLEEQEAHERRAFQVLCPDHLIYEAQLVEALLHGSERNSELLEALGLRVEKSMQVSEVYDAKTAEEAVEFMESVLKKMEGT